MKKFHVSSGVEQRFWRTSRIVVGIFVMFQLVVLQHVYLLNQHVSAVAVDTLYIEKLLSKRDVELQLKTSLVFMGDIMLARSIGIGIESGENPFIHVKEILKSHDVRIGNIETTIADPAFQTQATKAYTFNAPLSSLQTLKDIGMDVSSLANNHTGDYGRSATSDTLQQFKKAGLLSVGAGNTVEEAFSPLYVDSNGIRIGFIAVNDIELAYTKVGRDTPGSAYLDETLIAQSIRLARDGGADVVVVLPHWGTEYSTTQNSRQTQWAHFMIDAGADVVVGGHPHVVQPTEIYKGKQIVYSLGNFIFDGMSGEALNGQMISIAVSVSKTVTAGKTVSSVVSIDDAVKIPVRIDASGYPRP